VYIQFCARHWRRVVGGARFRNVVAVCRSAAHSYGCFCSHSIVFGMFLMFSVDVFVVDDDDL
jgi:hypothetical protein